MHFAIDKSKIDLNLEPLGAWPSKMERKTLEINNWTRPQSDFEIFDFLLWLEQGSLSKRKYSIQITSFRLHCQGPIL
jgi:hypothetical protein